MSDLQLFAVTSAGPQPLPVPLEATSFDDLYTGLAVGVYSALRTYEHNKFLCLEAHLDRTERSMALLGWGEALDRDSLRRALHEVCTAAPFADTRVRFDILAEPAYALGSDSRILIALMPFTPPPLQLYEQGVTVELTQELSRPQPLAKTADFAQQRRAFQEAQPSSAYESVLVSADGRLLEGTGTNFYGVRDGVVWTAGEGVLEGVTRRIILDLLPQLDIPLRLEAVHVSDIPHLDEAALSGSSRAVLPVVQIDGQVIGDGQPGPISRRILAAYNVFVQKAIKTAVESSRSD